MKKKFSISKIADMIFEIFELLLITILMILAISLSASILLYTRNLITQVHTYQNIAIYDSGVITDEDGKIFKKYFDISDNSVALVTYNNKNTVTRLDDEPIKLEIVR